jgi:hypothetical protein
MSEKMLEEARYVLCWSAVLTYCAALFSCCCPSARHFPISYAHPPWSFLSWFISFSDLLGRKIETLTHSYCRALSSEGKLAKAKSTLVVATCLYPDEAPIFFELWRVCCISDDFKHAAR